MRIMNRSGVKNFVIEKCGIRQQNYDAIKGSTLLLTNLLKPVLGVRIINLTEFVKTLISKSLRYWIPF